MALEASKSGGYNYEETFASNDDSAIADDMGPPPAGTISKARARRASEGSHLGGGKRASGELRCEKCGKGYKHSSCLTKHLSVFPDPLLSPFLACIGVIHGSYDPCGFFVDEPRSLSLQSNVC